MSLLSKGLSRVFSNTTIQKHQFFGAQLSLWSNSHIHCMTTGKTTALTRWTFISKAMSLLFNMLSRLVTAFLPRIECRLISWLQSSSSVILKSKKTKSATVAIVSPSICHEVMSTSWEELTHWKRPWCWEGLGAGGEGDDRGWDGWMASLTRWTWVWVNSRSWWWTGRPGVLQFTGSQRVGHEWATELTDWTDETGCHDLRFLNVEF